MQKKSGKNGWQIHNVTWAAQADNAEALTTYYFYFLI